MENGIQRGKDIRAVKPTHDEAEERLEQQASDHGPLRSEVVDDEGADECPGHVEETEGVRTEHIYIIIRNRPT